MAELCNTHLYFSRNSGMQPEKVLNTPHNEKRGIKVWISQLDPALKSRRTWKTFIRCWAVLTTTLVLMVSPEISGVIGQASFFCALVNSDFIIIFIFELDRYLQGSGPYDAAIDGRLCFPSSSIYNDHRYTSSLTPTISIAHFFQVCFSVGHGVMQQWQLLSTLEIPFNWLDRPRFFICRASFPVKISWNLRHFLGLIQILHQIFKLRPNFFTESFLTQGSLKSRMFGNDELITLSRSSAVYGAFFFIGTFALGVMRACTPNLTLLTIFATIVLDVVSIFYSQKRLLPSHQ